MQNKLLVIKKNRPQTMFSQVFVRPRGGGSLSVRPPPHYGKEQAVRIPLECFLVVTELFNTAVNDYDAKKSAGCSL